MSVIPFNDLVQAVTDAAASARDMALQTRETLKPSDAALSPGWSYTNATPLTIKHFQVSFEAHIAGLGPEDERSLAFVMKPGSEFRERDLATIEINVYGSDPPTGDVRVNGGLFRSIPMFEAI